MYASSSIFKRRSIQDSLRIDLFARKHNLTIEQVEIALEMGIEEIPKYVKSIKSSKGVSYEYARQDGFKDSY